MNKVMIDLETFGTGANAYVVQIGAAYFDDSGAIGKTLKINVTNSTGKMDQDTINWWISQSEEARNSILAGPKLDEYEAFIQLNNFLCFAHEIWSHATFDFVIMMETFKRLNIKPWFSYKAARDIRTLTALCNLKNKSHNRIGVAHDALDDCIYQIQYCTDCIKKLKEIK